MKSALVGGNAVVVAATGAVAAAAESSWDLFALFAVLVVLQLGIAVSLMGSRRLTTLRVDLDRWISRARRFDRRTALTDRRPQRRAAYSAGLVSPDD